MTIFQNTAPLYFAKNMSVIPLLPKTKIPCVKEWQTYAEKLPERTNIATWLDSKEDYNIGLVLGAQSRVCVVDIDYANEATTNLIKRICPETPWVRVGKKGCVMAFKYNPNVRPFKIVTKSHVSICEFLSKGNQVVLPPSIHPETKLPYHANCNLYDVVDELPEIPDDFEEILRLALKEHLGDDISLNSWTKTTEYVSLGARDSRITSMAGIYSLAVLRGELTLREALSALETWAENFVQQIKGDNVDIERAKKNLLTFLHRDIERTKKVLPAGWDAGLSMDELKSFGFSEPEELTAKSETQIRDFVRDGFEKFPEGTKERNEVMEKTIRYMIASDLEDIAQERLMKYMASLDRTVTVAVLRKTLLKSKTSGINGENHAEIARAVMNDLNRLLGENEKDDTFSCLRYLNNTFYRWVGDHWGAVEEHEILQHIANNYGSYPAAKRSSDHKGIMEVAKSLLSPEIQEDFTLGVNFSNGYVTQDGKILEHDKKYGATYVMPYRYFSGRTLDDAPMFKTFLYSCWGKDEDCEMKIQCLREIIGAILFGIAPVFARTILFHGVGGTGKSQLVSIIQSLLQPESVSFVSPYNFANRFQLGMLAGKLLNVCGELSEDNLISGDIFKLVVDGSPITAEGKGTKPFAFRSKAAQIFASNYLPMSRDTSSGFSRRWCILHFDNIVKTEDRVLGLGEQIAARERETIASWAVDSVKGLLARKDYSLPDSHFTFTNEMMATSDTVFFYLSAAQDGCPKQIQGSTTLTSALYGKYREFCFKNSARPVGSRRFFLRLRELSSTMGFGISSDYVVGLTI